MLMGWLFMKAGARRLSPDVVRSDDHFEISLVAYCLCLLLNIEPSANFSKEPSAVLI